MNEEPRVVHSLAIAGPDAHVITDMVRPMRSRRPILNRVATIAVTLAALGGCLAEPGVPSTLPSVPPATSPVAVAQTPSASAEPTPSTPAAPPLVKPVLPPKALENSPEGADAFVRHYFAVLDYAFDSGDAAAIAEVSEPECPPCRTARERIELATSRGETFEGAPHEINSVAVLDASSGVAEVRVGYVAYPGVRLAADQDILETADGGRLNVLMMAVHTGEAWLMADYAKPHDED